MLKATDICKSFPTRSGELTVLRDVTLSLDPGDSAAIMGPSGSGKSTLLNILGTLERPTSGTVLIDGSEPFSQTKGAWGDRELADFRNRRVGFVFQDHHLLPQCTVLENVLLPTLARTRDKDRSDQAQSLLASVGLADRMDHRPSELSGGERQRVAVARALVNDPAVVLADEPTGNLDRHTAQRVVDLLLQLHQEAKRVLIVVTHSDDVAKAFSKRMVIVDGRLGEV